MIKVSLSFFYQMGFSIDRLKKIGKVKENNKWEILFAALGAESFISSILDELPALSVCRSTGHDLLGAIKNIENWSPKFDKIEQAQQSTFFDEEFAFQQVIDKATKFETLFIEEIKTLTTYCVTPKAIYSTSELIDSAEKILPASLLGKLDVEAIKEIQESGKCLALDTFTASGFHIMRAIERVLHQYYLIMCKPSDPKRLDNWAAYLSKLNDVNDDHAKKTVPFLQQIKDQHRNLIMHPEITLSEDDALILFQTGTSIIMTMAEKL